MNDAKDLMHWHTSSVDRQCSHKVPVVGVGVQSVGQDVVAPKQEQQEPAKPSSVSACSLLASVTSEWQM